MTVAVGPAVPEPGLFAYPAKIQVQTLDRCNYECPMCPYPEVAGERATTRLDGDLFRRMVDEIGAAGQRVKLCLMLQNEPLLDRRFLDFVAYAHAAEDAVASISTVTNGSALDVTTLDRLMAFERFHLTISVNATDSERYRRVHGRDLWDKVNGLLTGWTGPRHRVRLSFVLDGDSLDDGREFRSHWRDLGYATRMVPINARVDSMEVPSRLHAVDLDFGHCHYPVDTLNVLADGSVILCCNDWLHHERYGNLREATIAEIWNAPELVRLRRLAIEGRLREMAMCKACDYPLRSSRRLVLEALVGDEPDRVPADVLDTAGHRSLVESADGRRLPALVWDLDAEAGTADLAVAAAAGDLAGPVHLQLRIGHTGEFSFGSLEPVWCPGRAHRLDLDLGVEGLVPVRVELDPSAEQFDVFRWYCADWKLA